MSLQDVPQIRRSDSRSSLVSTVSNVTEAESVDTCVSRVRNMSKYIEASICTQINFMHVVTIMVFFFAIRFSSRFTWHVVPYR